MRAPLSWIRDFTPVDADPSPTSSSALNQLGLEVEGVEQPGRGDHAASSRRRCSTSRSTRTPTSSSWSTSTPATGTTRGRVRRAERRRRAWSCRTRPSGATLPGGLHARAAQDPRRGESDGMLCSAQELGLGDDHSGILGLDPGTELGADVRDVLGLDDVVFDLAITPNRPDAMCIVGVARELAAHFALDFAVPEPSAPTDAAVAQRRHRRRSSDRARCPRYLGRRRPRDDGAVAGVDGAAPGEGGHAPDQQRRRRHQLRAARAQPAAARVRPRPPRRPRDRRARSRDDGRDHDHARRRRAHAHRRGPPHLRRRARAAGDRRDHGRRRRRRCPTTTTEILLESAYFERMGIARSSKRLKLRSESSARFERGIDPDGDRRATPSGRWSCSREVAGAQVGARRRRRVPGAGRAGPRSASAPSRVNAVLGTDLDAEDVRDVARAARHRARRRRTTGDGDDRDRDRRPTFRPDLDREIDLVEEVARRDRLRPHRPHAARHPRPGRRAHRPPAGAPAGRRRPRRRRAVARRSRCSLVAPADLERAGAAARPGRARPRTRCGPRSRCCAPRSCPGCSGPSPATGPRGSPTSRCSRWAACSSRRRRRRRRQPAARRARARRARAGRARCRAARSRTTARSTSTTRSTRSGSCSTRSASPTSCSSRRRRHRLPRRPRRRVSSSTATTSGTVGEVAPEVLDGARARRRRWSRPSSTLDALLDAARRDRTFRAPSRVPGVEHRPRVRRSTTPCAAADVVAHAARARSATLLEDVRAVRRVPSPTRSAPAAGASRSRCASARPTARSPTPRSPRCGSGRSTRWSRRTAPSSAGERVRPPRSGPGTRRSTSRASSSTPTGSPTSTTRRTRFFESLGFDPKEAFFRDFDVMIVKAVLEWEGPAGFDEMVDIAVAPGRARHEVVRPRVTPRRSRARPACIGHDHLRVGRARHPRLGGSPERPADGAARLTACSSGSAMTPAGWSWWLRRSRGCSATMPSAPSTCCSALAQVDRRLVFDTFRFFELDLDDLRERIEEIASGGAAPSGHIPFTSRAKKVLELSLREALALGRLDHPCGAHPAGTADRGQRRRGTSPRGIGRRSRARSATRCSSSRPRRSSPRGRR